ncbi:MAG: dihydrofolate reductase [Candidatus Campbellbacteria bacterium]|nr:dihydrofolate reductase [Candidatus Campbellbacteria bacterium]
MSSEPKILMLATIAGEDRVISKDGALPWRIPEDEKHFSSTIKNQTVIIGRKAFEANVRDLKNARHKIVLTQNINLFYEGVITAYSPEDALQKAQELGSKEVVVVGGGLSFATFLPQTTTLYLTVIDQDLAGDITFPECNNFEIVSEEEKKLGRNTITFTELERKKAA